jgi:hypothetical protein
MKKSTYGLRKIVIKIDGEEFPSFEKVILNPRWRHHKAIHFARTTGCGLGITKSLKSESNMIDVTCPDCLRRHIGFLSNKLKSFEGILDEVMRTPALASCDKGEK